MVEHINKHNRTYAFGCSSRKKRGTERGVFDIRRASTAAFDEEMRQTRKSYVRFKDMPIQGVHIPKDDEDKIMHIGLAIGESTLMATDTLESLGQKLLPGNNVHISIHPESKEEADRIFAALSAGGAVEMPIADQMWGDYYGSFKDTFGVQWMVNYTSTKER